MYLYTYYTAIRMATAKEIQVSIIFILITYNIYIFCILFINYYLQFFITHTAQNETSVYPLDFQNSIPVLF